MQDWSIRVGVFEGMLYAVLATLAKIGDVNIQIEGVEPAKVNRFWLSKAASGAAADTTMPTGRAVKKFKVDLIGQVLEGSLSTKMDMSVEVDNEAMPMVGSYLRKWRKDDCSTESPSKKCSTDSSAPVAELSKLDDLADCLLQGMAWIEWENNRARIAASDNDEALPFM